MVAGQELVEDADACGVGNEGETLNFAPVQARAVRRKIIFALFLAIASGFSFSLMAEAVARFFFTESRTTTMTCLIANDPHTGVRAVPNSHCWQKAFESTPIEYRFNDCGFRTPQSCKPAPAGMYRVLLLGSSQTYGMHVGQSQSFAGVLGPILTQRLHRPVDVFNEGMEWAYPSSIALRTEALVRPRPNLIVWTLVPFDIEHVDLILPYIPNVQEEYTVGSQRRRTAPVPAKVLSTLPTRALNRVINELSQTRAVFALQHYLFRSDSQYLSHVLAQGSSADYLRSPTPADFRENLKDFAIAFRKVAARAKEAGIPIVVTSLPSRAQIIMLSNGRWPAGYDPNVFPRSLRKIVESDGGIYVDMTSRFGKRGRFDSLFLPVDEHLNPNGHLVFADLLADAIQSSGKLPPPARVH